MLAVFALLVILTTLAIQWFLGVLHQGSATRKSSATKSQEGGKNLKKKEMADSPKLERPKSLPEPASGGDAPWVRSHPRHPAVMCPGLEVNPTARLPTVTSSESSESLTLQPGVTEERIMAIMEEIAREEQMWAEIRANPEVAAQDQQGENLATLAFQIYTTRYGSVYHCHPQCGYLRAAQTGPRRELTWCHLCRYVAQRGRGSPPPGIPIWIAGWGGIAHTDPRCPRSSDGRETRLRTQCQMNSNN